MSVTPREMISPPQQDVVVECHSGHTYAQRPTAFWWENERFEVATIEAEWRSPTGKHFQVKTRNEATFELIYREAGDCWQIERSRSC